MKEPNRRDNVHYFSPTIELIFNFFVLDGGFFLEEKKGKMT